MRSRWVRRIWPLKNGSDVVLPKNPYQMSAEQKNRGLTTFICLPTLALRKTDSLGRIS